MIKNIEFINYKKLKDITIKLKKGVNVIAGTNGTCKSSILHIISNTYKMIPLNAEYFKDKNCVKTIKDLNKSLTPKIESLTKAHLNYNPDEKINGDILKVEFMDNKVQAFRNHKSDKYKRYAIKPYYPRGKKERLREAMVIYLSVDRLLSFGEFLDDSSISKVNKILPEKINSELIEKYREFTLYKIKEMKTEKMGKMKVRGRFKTEEIGVDSNTISVGEDNLFILLSAFYSLKYFCEELKDEYKSLPAILLIDEFDAALHPEFQIKLLNLFAEVCKNFPNMQIIFTSHSITTLEETLNKKFNLIYLLNDIKKIRLFDTSNISEINSLLQNKLHEDYYKSRYIPVILEDEEARIFLDVLFDHFSETSFGKIKKYFRIDNKNYSCEAIINLFSRDSAVEIYKFPAIGIIDGDKEIKEKTDKALLVLPGGDSPEKIIFETIKLLLIEENEISESLWDRLSQTYQFTKLYVTSNLIKELEKIETEIEKLQNEGKSKGVRREKYKKIFKNHDKIFKEILSYWVKHPKNQSKVDKFYEELKICFMRVAKYNGLYSLLWEEENNGQK